MISALNISKQFGNQILFKDVTFTLNARERIGLVGRNGHGKSTLFRILCGEDSCDEGKILIPNNYTIGHLSQHLDFTKATVLEEACLGLSEENIHDEWKAEKILSGLGFSESDFPKNPLTFSGGYQLRINLAKVLLSEPNLLLLDEPTNFLDIVSIRWLIPFLKSWKNEMIIISHDRNFMDSVVTHIMGIHRQDVKKLGGTTGAYYNKVAEEEELYEKQRINEGKKRAETEDFVNRFRAKASKAKQVQSRVKALEKMGRLDRLDSIAGLRFSFNGAPFPAKQILEVSNLGFSYGPDQPKLINDFSLTVGKRDRICIIGKNGKGKTTLLKLLADVLTPIEGEITYHPQAQKAYFEQSNTGTLHEDMTIEEELLSNHPTGDRKVSRSICGAMMFSGDLALKKIGVLSGGEKCRVMLGNLLLKPANILLLDEPTNHLDMEASDSLMEAINAFDGATIMITHSEGILKGVATRLIVFDDEGISLFEGGYKSFLKEVGWTGEENKMSRSESSSDKVEGKGKQSKKELRKARAALTRQRLKVLKPLEEKVKALESEIETLEIELSTDNEALIKASHEKDSEAIALHSKSAQEIQSKLDVLYEGIGIASDEYEREKALFHKEEAF